MPEQFDAILSAEATQELEVLHQILEEGIDQGWFFRANETELLIPSPSMQEEFCGLIGTREAVKLQNDDPWSENDPEVIPIEGEQAGWSVLTQRCDLLRSYCIEPLVEVARTYVVEGDAARAAKTNSPRLIALAEAESGLWVVDLRQRAWLPKHNLLTQSDLRPAISGKARKRFRLRLGQRYWRDPVPDDVAAKLQGPLRNIVKASTARVRKLSSFSMWLGQRADDGRTIVIAVAEDERLDEAEEDWNGIVALLGERQPDAHATIEPEQSGVFSPEDISLGIGWSRSSLTLTRSRIADVQEGIMPSPLSSPSGED
ncbi:hypothetical protein VSS74_12210 [Conexibacter stalactiti]|uniref:Uncharacterized protein n=1 Tax=Conexibacter stalactiti TaxID=1940611 RepID=A0ABU4HPA9_9ACTN|nr:hypothetical protein [Conexibacter stalactiti]MDW5595107.1 hypothetical protein [Conexibacter stalactiti]MEC5035749.1 hypothetical protein [Conexibacter stalactiti]